MRALLVAIVMLAVIAVAGGAGVVLVACGSGGARTPRSIDEPDRSATRAPDAAVAPDAAAAHDAAATPAAAVALDASIASTTTGPRACPPSYAALRGTCDPRAHR